MHAPVRHDSAVGHLTGHALYIDDLPLVAGTLHGALVLSLHAHARIHRHSGFGADCEGANFNVG